MSNFDLSELALKSLCPNNEILYDDKGMPSVMVRIPKMTYAEAGIGDSTATLPAFLVNGQEVDSIYIGKYQASVQNNRAYSLPGCEQRSNVTFDQAFQYCANKGEGWHLMTNAEWGAIMRWCAVRSLTPIGNNNWGKHSSESVYTAIPADYEAGKRRRVLTGTGPLTWSHDGTPAGIWDLCGNVWEWAGGIRTVYGELQFLVNNNAADSSISQAANGAAWRAIDATTGEFITPNGSGTTANSVKLDFVSGKLQYSTTITDTAKGGHWFDGFAGITCAASISDAAKRVLQAYGMLPVGTKDFTQSQWCGFNNAEAERSFCRGGHYGDSGNGFPSFYGSYGRGGSFVHFGFRAAYVKLPTAN